MVSAATTEAAVLDAIGQICAGRSEQERIRFVVDLPRTSLLWRYDWRAGAAPADLWIERPASADGALIQAAASRLQSRRPATNPQPVVVATDGSVRRKHAGYGWLASSGDFGLGGYRSSPKRIGVEPVLVAELLGIGAAICGLPDRNVTVLTDSRSAIAMANRWKRGESVLPAGYPDPHRAGPSLRSIQRHVHAEHNRIELVWVRGHSGEPLNEGADALARLGSRFRRGDPDLDEEECDRRAAGIAKAFAAEFRRRGVNPGGRASLLK